MFVRTFYGLINLLTRYATKRYITVSEYLKKQLVDSGISVAKVTVIYNGVALPDDKAGEPVLDSSIRTQNDKVVIGSIGRLHKVKNYAELIIACASLKKKNWNLKIIGDGKERIKLEQIIQDYGVEDKVEILGNVENARKLLDQIDIYVQPSLSEGFGLTVIEAMLARIPVIVSPFGSLPELVVHNKTGIVMKGSGHEEITAAIEDLLLHKEKVQSIAEAGQRFARENFSVEGWTKETQKAYLEATK
jgi:glycosyltransferase involved in cell wall biosynthesis